MSTQVTTAFVKQYSANVFFLAQQKGSRMRNAVRIESQTGDSAFYDRIGVAVAQARVGRHTDTPQIDTPHSRRRVTLLDYEYGDLIDDADKIRMLMDPTSEYAMAAVWALGRAMDDVLIAAADGSAFGAVDGSSTVAHPNTQKIASVSGGAGANINVQALRRAKKILDSNDVDPDIPRYVAINAAGLESLLSETETTSSDFASVKALVQGELDTFMGFNFIRLERLLLQSGTLNFDVTTGAVGSGAGNANTYRRMLAWAQDGLLLALGQDVKARIAERADKSFSTQVYASMGIGATRMEEAKVVVILADD